MNSATANAFTRWTMSLLFALAGNVVSAASSTVTGNVVDDHGVAIAHARVTVTDLSGASLVNSVRVPASGRFSITLTKELPQLWCAVAASGFSPRRFKLELDPQHHAFVAGTIRLTPRIRIDLLPIVASGDQDWLLLPIVLSSADRIVVPGVRIVGVVPGTKCLGNEEPQTFTIQENIAVERGSEHDKGVKGHVTVGVTRSSDFPTFLGDFEYEPCSGGQFRIAAHYPIALPAGTSELRVKLPRRVRLSSSDAAKHIILGPPTSNSNATIGVDLLVSDDGALTSGRVPITAGIGN